jgi:hypothetical protein
MPTDRHQIVHVAVEIIALKIKVRNKNFFIKNSLIVEAESYFVCQLP